MCSHNEETVSMVLFNDLILEKIFSNLTLTELFPLRLTSKTWNFSLNKRISEDKIVQFDFSSTNKSKNLVKIKYFKELKIQKVFIFCLPYCLHCLYQHGFFGCNLEARNIFEELKKNGTQLRSLELETNLNIGTKEIIGFLKTIFSSFANLKYFSVSLRIDVPLFIEEFKDFVYPSLRFLNLLFSSVSSPEDGEEFVKKVLKMFPNLDTNFNSEAHDIKLLDMIKKKLVSPFKIRNYQVLLSPGNTDCLNMVATVSFNLTRLELPCIAGLEPIVLTQILQNFSKTLVDIKLFNNARGKYIKYEGEICLPPLPNARKIWLGVPPFSSSKGYLNFSWNFGAAMAKDFPRLEYLTFKVRLFDLDSMRKVNEEEVVLFGESWCKLWECFVPLSHENDEEWDFQPLQFLKLVDLSFPSHWIGQEENREWCNSFLRVHQKLYGNGGKVRVIQDMINWLE